MHRPWRMPEREHATGEGPPGPCREGVRGGGKGRGVEGREGGGVRLEFRAVEVSRSKRRRV